MQSKELPNSLLMIDLIYYTTGLTFDDKNTTYK